MAIINQLLVDNKNSNILFWQKLNLCNVGLRGKLILFPTLLLKQTKFKSSFWKIVHYVWTEDVGCCNDHIFFNQGSRSTEVSLLLFVIIESRNIVNKNSTYMSFIMLLFLAEIH